MALVGEARIVVRAITSGIEKDIRDGFQNIEGVGTDAGQKLGRGYGKGFLNGFNKSRSTSVFGKLADAFRAIEGEAEAARKKFTEIVKTAHYVDVAVYGIAASIVALGGAIAGLGGALLGAASSLAVLVNSMISFKIGMSVVKLALGGVGQAVSAAAKQNSKLTNSLAAARAELKKLKFDAEEAALSEKRAGLNLERAREALLRVQDLPPNSAARREAQLAYEEAELAYRRAKSNAKDLAEQQKKGLAGTKAAGGGTDPYAGLTKSQAEFAKYLVSIRSKMEELKEAVASGFLPSLKIAIENLLKTTFPTLKAGLREVSISMGAAAIEFSNVLGTAENQKALKEFFTNVATNVKPLGKILGNSFGALVHFLNAIQKPTERFLTWIVDLSDRFKAFTESNPKGIEKFFTLAGDSAAKVGKIFKNVFKGLFSIVEENLKPGSGGQMLLDWLEKATAGFADIGKNKDFRKFFRESAKITIEIFGFFGKLFGLFADAGTDPNILKFWKILNSEENFKNINKIFDSASEAMPIVGEILVSIGKVITVISESKGVITFFQMIKNGLDAIVFLLNNPVFKTLLGIFGPILAGLSGIAVIGRKFKFVGLVIVGAFKLIGRFASILFGTITKIPIIGPLFQKLADKIKNSKIGQVLDNITKKFRTMGDEAKKDDQKIGDSVKGTTEQLGKMLKATSKVEAAFKKMNSAIAKTNGLLSTLRSKSGTSATAMGKLRDAAGTASTKISKVKTESKQAAAKLDVMKKKANDAKKALQDLGKVKSNPSIGTGGAGGAGGGGGEMPTILPIGSAMKGLKSPLGKAGLIGAAVSVAASVVTDQVTAIAQPAIEAAKSEKVLAALAKANGGLGKSAKEVGKQLIDLAYNQSAVTGISADQYIAVEKLLMKYPSLAKTSGDVNGAFRNMVKASADVAVAIGTDAPTAAQIMADALKNPKTAMQELSDQGIIFTQKEKDKYDAVLKTNGPMAAQKLLLDDIKTRYGDIAKSSTTTADKAAGSWSKAAVQVGKFLKPLSDFFNDFGAALGDLVFVLFGGKPNLNKKQKDFVNKVNSNLKNVSGNMYIPGTGISSGYSGNISGLGGNKNGGFIGFGRGGYVSGAGTARSDSIRAMLSNGEYVVNARATAANRELLDAINSNKAVGPGNSITVVVNPSPQMDERALAAMVSRRIAFEIRKGTI